MRIDDAVRGPKVVKMVYRDRNWAMYYFYSTRKHIFLLTRKEILGKGAHRVFAQQIIGLR